MKESKHVRGLSIEYVRCTVGVILPEPLHKIQIRVQFEGKSCEKEGLKGNQVRILDNTRCCMGIAAVQNATV